MRQNFVLSLGDNAIALPFAIAGYITPLIAAGDVVIVDNRGR